MPHAGEFTWDDITSSLPDKNEVKAGAEDAWAEAFEKAGKRLENAKAAEAKGEKAQKEQPKEKEQPPPQAPS